MFVNVQITRVMSSIVPQVTNREFAAFKPTDRVPTNPHRTANSDRSNPCLRTKIS
jgi:hypothetical protein